VNKTGTVGNPTIIIKVYDPSGNVILDFCPRKFSFTISFAGLNVGTISVDEDHFIPMVSAAMIKAQAAAWNAIRELLVFFGKVCVSLFAKMDLRISP